MFVRIISFLSALAILALSFGCKQEGFTQKFNAGLSRGDLLEVDIDTNAMTYSFVVTEGDLKGKPEGKGSGKLVREASLGQNAYLTDSNPPAFVLAIENKVAVGVVGRDFYVGVPKKDEKIGLSEVAGIYNFVSYLPNGIPGQREKTTLEGTVEILADGKGKVVFQADIAHATQANSHAIKLVPQSEGIFSILSDDTKETKLANFLPRLDSQNNIFAVIDFADPKVLKGIGFAQKQRILEENSLNGSYLAYETGSPEVTRGQVQGANLILNNSLLKNATATVTLNYPWAGVVHGKLGNVFDFFGIYSGSELYSILVKKGQSRPQAFIAIKE